MDHPAQGPLAGFRILEFCSTLSGPLATMLLADQGADVIKIETPQGDQARQVGYRRAGVPDMSTMFVNINRNKRSVVLNLKDPADLDRAVRLAATADVIVQNFRPGVMDRMGLGYEALRSTAPGLIYVSLSGLGEAEQVRGRRVYDIVSQGIAGFCAVQADRTTGEPRTVQSAVTDKIASLVVWQGVTAALLHRLRTGQGQHLKVNMLSAALSFLWPEAMPAATFTGPGVQAGGTLAGVQYVFATRDGHVLVGHVSNDEFAASCRALGIGQLIGDPRFDSIGSRFRNAADLNRLFADALAQGETAHWLARLAAEDAVYAPVNTAATIAEDPIIAAAGVLADHDHPVYGSFRQPVHPVDFGASPAAYRRHPPLLGEHTAEVLAELAAGGGR
ncbi:CoA transferase [Gemmobacter sp.]|uniref:CaiB/BaiF CoA transferase family protein n=1 Tax=Gemmobacter sp. TaxID=1898957 RepID=UPI002AFE4AE7|nr:CoA transferase [Gemmobacter sp.]